MAKFEKGNKVATGRPKGALNRSTEEMKLTIARATNNVLSTLNKDLEDIRKKNPEKALELAFKLLEYSLPKLSRTEMSGEINQKIQQISVNITQKVIDEPRD
jgi:arginine utilization protein RocB